MQRLAQPQIDSLALEFFLTISLDLVFIIYVALFSLSIVQSISPACRNSDL